MTTNDIEYAQVTLLTKDGRCLIGRCENDIALFTIASYVKFVEVDANNVAEINLSELRKQD